MDALEIGVYILQLPCANYQVIRFVFNTHETQVQS
jgi:hypothetical protein